MEGGEVVGVADTTAELLRLALADPVFQRAYLMELAEQNR